MNSMFTRGGLGLILFALVVVQGCGRQPVTPQSELAAEAPRAEESQPSATTKQPVAATPTVSPQQTAPDQLPTAPNDSSLRLPIHQELTGAIHLYQMDKQKLPADFDALVKAKYLKAMPKPPPGKRFALDRNRMQVVITD